MVETIVSVGQLQLLRKQFAHRLYLAANVQAKGLCSSLNAMNQYVFFVMCWVLFLLSHYSLLKNHDVVTEEGSPAR